jgi:hypothetical protein
MRQRIPAKGGAVAGSGTSAGTSTGTPSRDDSLKVGSTSTHHIAHAWEITSDATCSNKSSGGESSSSSANQIIAQPVPMFNPLHYSAINNNNNNNTIHPPPGSFPSTSWRQYNDPPRLQLGAAPRSSSAGGLLLLNSPTQTTTTSTTARTTTQLPSLAPAIIPDSRYQAYLMGRPLDDPTTKNHTDFVVVDKICCAKACAGFSWVAVLFLLFVGILLDTQPLYISGTLPQHVQFTTGDRKAQVFYSITQSERLTPASHAYQAAFGYFITCLLSLAYAYNVNANVNRNYLTLNYLLHRLTVGGWFQTQLRREDYHDIPDADSTIAAFHISSHGSGSSVGELLPMTTTTTTTSSPAYQYSNHRQLSNRVGETMTLMVNRVRIYLASVWPTYQEHRRARKRETGPKDV